MQDRRKLENKRKAPKFPRYGGYERREDLFGKGGKLKERERDG